jgi:hypothetical protein
MSEQFKKCLYLNCSPTLRGIKPSNIFTLHKKRHPNWEQDLAECRSALQRHGYELLLLNQTEEFLIVMVYQPDTLNRCLSQKERREFLRSMGYQETLSLEGKLELLGRRYQRSNFPHEIGLFLGYPIDDVFGFISNHGENFKYSGEWKVYGDVKQAKKLFQAYQDSRRSVIYQASQGMELEDILRAC